MLALYFALLTVLVTEGSRAQLNKGQATPHQYPYHVGLYENFILPEYSFMSFHCQGTVITERWILTAAYCLDLYSPSFVKAGKYIINMEEPNEQVRRIVHCIIHPEYNSSTRGIMYYNDIAMIKVDTPFVFNDYVSAAVLPSANASFFNGSLAGWYLPYKSSLYPGNHDELFYNRELTIINIEDCNKLIKEKSGYSGLFLKIDSNPACSIGNDKRIGTCFTYVGSAFVSQEDDKYFVIGVVSKTWYLCGIDGAPTVYTRIGPYLEWINKVIDSY